MKLFSKFSINFLVLTAEGQRKKNDHGSPLPVKYNPYEEELKKSIKIKKNLNLDENLYFCQKSKFSRKSINKDKKGRNFDENLNIRQKSKFSGKSKFCKLNFGTRF